MSSVKFVRSFLTPGPLDAGKKVTSFRELALRVDDFAKLVDLDREINKSGTKEVVNILNQSKVTNTDTIQGPSYTDDSGNGVETKIIRKDEEPVDTLHYTD